MDSSYRQRFFASLTLLFFVISLFPIHSSQAIEKLTELKKLQNVEMVGQLCYLKFGKDDIYHDQLIEKVFGIVPAHNPLYTQEYLDHFTSDFESKYEDSEKFATTVDTLRENINDSVYNFQVAAAMLTHQRYKKSENVDFKTFFKNPKVFHYTNDKNYQDSVTKAVTRIDNALQNIDIGSVDFYSEETQNELKTINQQAAKIRSQCGIVHRSASDTLLAKESTKIQNSYLNPKIREYINSRSSISDETYDQFVNYLTPIVTTKIAPLLGSEISVNMNDCKNAGENYFYLAKNIDSDDLSSLYDKKQMEIAEGLNRGVKNYNEQEHPVYVQKIIKNAPQIVQASLVKSGSINEAVAACDAIGEIYKQKEKRDNRVVATIIVGMVLAPIALGAVGGIIGALAGATSRAIVIPMSATGEAVVSSAATWGATTVSLAGITGGLAWGSVLDICGASILFFLVKNPLLEKIDQDKWSKLDAKSRAMRIYVGSFINSNPSRFEFSNL